jgi:hypothetical protein
MPLFSRSSWACHLISFSGFGLPDDVVRSPGASSLG